jgi:hypothetical protein
MAEPTFMEPEPAIVYTPSHTARYEATHVFPLTSTISTVRSQFAAVPLVYIRNPEVDVVPPIDMKFELDEYPVVINPPDVPNWIRQDVVVVMETASVIFLAKDGIPVTNPLPGYVAVPT